MSGSGERFGSYLPKQFHNLSGKRVYLHTLERFLISGLFDEILLVSHPEWTSTIQEDLQAYSHHPIRIITGGKSRQESSYLGLQACGEQTQIVVIHDAVRPFVSQEILKQNIEAAGKWGAADTCIPSTDTIVHSKNLSKITSIPNRSEHLRGQTPQSFSYPLILSAHQKTNKNDSTDDCTLVIEQGHPVHIVWGDETNMKITTELDLTLAEQLFYREKQHTTAEPITSLKGEIVVVAGGTGGIGEAIVSALRAEEARPLILARTAGDYQADLSSFDEVQRIFQEIYLDHGPIFGLINCVGRFQVKDLHHMSPEEISQLIQTNFTGVIAACQSVKVKPGGHIINFASSSYSRGRKGYCVYSATKAAVVNFTQGFALERPTLSINAIAPQRTNTPLRRAHFPDEEPTTLLSPKEIAYETLSLLKLEGITGSVIEVRRQASEPAISSHNS